jgi:hypothetical protein
VEAAAVEAQTRIHIAIPAIPRLMMVSIPRAVVRLVSLGFPSKTPFINMPS